ncbi:O-methyltransferase [Daejeonella lutea]|uniref:O-methyltransferase n=2 Tax=Daejeonella lutea TaxID=572036 RepID=A0A1T5DY80_9SPHI|nr:O-methyltransferase [Daejeonella lutea]
MAALFPEILSEFYQLAKQQYKFMQLVPVLEERVKLQNQFRYIHKKVDCPHNESHVLSFINEMLGFNDTAGGCFVEAGAYKGGSSSKLSIIANKLNKKLFVFDSFEGLPKNDENHLKTINGSSIEGWFDETKFCGSLDEVKGNIEKYGEIQSCIFNKGWFEDTMPGFKERILAAYIDVDLASSTKTCLKYFYPLLVPGGVICSQDGDFPLVIDAIDDNEFWREELGIEKPKIEGLRKNKIIKIRKPINAD